MVAVTLSPIFPEKLILGMEIRDKVVALVSVRSRMRFDGFFLNQVQDCLVRLLLESKSPNLP